MQVLFSPLSLQGRSCCISCTPLHRPCLEHGHLGDGLATDGVMLVPVYTAHLQQQAAAWAVRGKPKLPKDISSSRFTKFKTHGTAEHLNTRYKNAGVMLGVSGTQNVFGDPP